MLNHDVHATQRLVKARREGSLRRSLSDIATVTARNLRFDLPMLLHCRSAEAIFREQAVK